MSLTYAQKQVVINQQGQELETENYINAVIVSDGLNLSKGDSYLKAFGNVVNINLSLTSDNGIKNNPIAILPESLRPKADIVLYGYSDDSEYLAPIMFKKNGEVSLMYLKDTTSSVLINATWVI